MPIYIAVFTAKGGVGKTVTAAHVAGALRLIGRSVVLIDADPQRNLYDAVGQYLTIHAGNRSMEIVQVFTDDEADKRIDRMKQQPSFVVVDCSPSPVAGDATGRYLKMADCCIVPVTLSPLGVGRHGHRITDTVKYIRQDNKHSRIFVLVNKYPARMNEVNSEMLGTARRTTKFARAVDKNFYLIDPEHDGIKIRESGALASFGSSSDVFKPGVTKHPREDFLSLISHLKDKGFLNQRTPEAADAT